LGLYETILWTATKMEMIMALVVKCMLCSLWAVQAVRSLVL
jgi:hypothetical protein